MAELTKPMPTARKPAVIVDNIHVNYKVLATGKRAGAINRTLFKSRREVQNVHALRGESFTAYDNESIGVIGHIGSGKYTFMRSITSFTNTIHVAVYTDR